MTIADPHDVALAAIYLAAGFDVAAKQDSHGEMYAAWADAGGHVGAMSDLAGYAAFVEQWLIDTDKTEFPGVFHYEFTEPLGAWLYASGEPANDEFKAELERRWKEWTDDKQR